MNKILLSAMIAATLLSCSEKKEEDFVRESFREYVKTDFDDPNDFIEISDIALEDSTNISELFRSSCKAAERAIKAGMIKKSTIEEYKEIKNDIENETSEYYVVTYKVKARVMNGRKKEIATFNAIDYGNGEYEISKKDAQMDGLKHPYDKFYEVFQKIFKEVSRF